MTAPDDIWHDDDRTCPDDFPDGTCKYCGAARNERHRDDCATRIDDAELDAMAAEALAWQQMEEADGYGDEDQLH